MIVHGEPAHFVSLLASQAQHLDEMKRVYPFLDLACLQHMRMRGMPQAFHRIAGAAAACQAEDARGIDEQHAGLQFKVDGAGVRAAF